MLLTLMSESHYSLDKRHCFEIWKKSENISYNFSLKEIVLTLMSEMKVIILLIKGKTQKKPLLVPNPPLYHPPLLLLSFHSVLLFSPKYKLRSCHWSSAVTNTTDCFCSCLHHVLQLWGHTCSLYRSLAEQEKCKDSFFFLPPFPVDSLSFLFF